MAETFLGDRSHWDMHLKPSEVINTTLACTIGPASNNVECLRQLVDLGMRMVRMNFSVGTHEYHSTIIENVKALEKGGCPPISLMIDTKGPEIRTGKVIQDVHLVKGQSLIITTDVSKREQCDKKCIFVDYADLPTAVKPGSHIYVDDGLLDFTVQTIDYEKGELAVTVQNSGVLSSFKGVNLPDGHINLPALSDLDKDNLRFGVEKGIHLVMASFMRTAVDVREIREFLNACGGEDILIMAKIENYEGLKNYEEILAEADAVCIARGDLGIETSLTKVILAQKMMSARALTAGVPVMNATHMLDSMIVNPRPTRAEAADCANSVLDGITILLLSGETAKGAYPVESLAMLREQCLVAEAVFPYKLFLLEQLREMSEKVFELPQNLFRLLQLICLKPSEPAALLLPHASDSVIKTLAKFILPCPVYVGVDTPRHASLLNLYRSIRPVVASENAQDRLREACAADFKESTPTLYLLEENGDYTQVEA